MDDYLEQRTRERKREYHRKWRAEHPENVKAAQMRYWTRQAERMQAEARQADADDHACGGSGPAAIFEG